MLTIADLAKEAGAPSGVPARLLHHYAPIGDRRDTFEPAEQSAIAAGTQQWMPELIETDATPIPDMMANPGRQAILGGVAGGAAGAGLGYLAGGHYGQPGVGAAVGGLALGGIGALTRFLGQRKQNDHLTEVMRRLPAGATKRDYDGERMLADAFEEKFSLDRLAKDAAANYAPAVVSEIAQDDVLPDRRRRRRRSPVDPAAVAEAAAPPDDVTQLGKLLSRRGRRTKWADAQDVIKLFAPHHNDAGLFDVGTKPDGSLYVNVGDWADPTYDAIRKAAGGKVEIVDEAAGTVCDAPGWTRHWPKPKRAAVEGEDCPSCGAILERGDDGRCNRCRKPWPIDTAKAAADPNNAIEKSALDFGGALGKGMSWLGSMAGKAAPGVEGAAAKMESGAAGVEGAAEQSFAGGAARVAGGGAGAAPIWHPPTPPSMFGPMGTAAGKVAPHALQGAATAGAVYADPNLQNANPYVRGGTAIGAGIASALGPGSGSYTPRAISSNAATGYTLGSLADVGGRLATGQGDLSHRLETGRDFGFRYGGAVAGGAGAGQAVTNLAQRPGIAGTAARWAAPAAAGTATLGGLGLGAYQAGSDMLDAGVNYAGNRIGAQIQADLPSHAANVLTGGRIEDALDKAVASGDPAQFQQWRQVMGAKLQAAGGDPNSVATDPATAKQQVTRFKQDESMHALGFDPAKVRPAFDMAANPSAAIQHAAESMSPEQKQQTMNTLLKGTPFENLPGMLTKGGNFAATAMGWLDHISSKVLGFFGVDAAKMSGTQKMLAMIGGLGIVAGGVAALTGSKGLGATTAVIGGIAAAAGLFGNQMGLFGGNKPPQAAGQQAGPQQQQPTQQPAGPQLQHQQPGVAEEIQPQAIDVGRAGMMSQAGAEMQARGIDLAKVQADPNTGMPTSSDPATQASLEAAMQDPSFQQVWHSLIGFVTGQQRQQ